MFCKTIQSINFSRSQIDEEIVGCSNYVDGQVMMLPREIVVLKSIVISTLCACTRLVFFKIFYLKNLKKQIFIFIKKVYNNITTKDN